ncbi:hypothetical protein GALMADRAFT_204784 [Galerina marginata CBS 339.88]|uniref:Small-subunit processome Utp12 domain-containing protein n=1 Tax=Galerina marginata (strain CBS 339.88) TaxID=685588 RepID=A0A067TZ30_GALM3|nr:hypothetical protein GALMADRAFT_204784 [Galerina marginata CBS 339.88]
MALSKKSSSSRKPTSTSVISQPSQIHTRSILSSFSPDASLFAIVVLAIDKHRIRVYNSTTGRAISEHTVESGRVSSLKWATIVPEPSSQERISPSKKRKKSENPTGGQEVGPEVDVLALGLSDGSVLFFSPSHSKILRTLTHPASTSPILSLAFDPLTKASFWASSADSSIRLWDIQKNTILRSWKSEDRIPYTALSIRPISDGGCLDLVVARHSIHLYAGASASESTTGKPKQLAGFTGHATCINRLLWTHGKEKSTKFFSMAEGDRHIYYWDTEDASSTEKPLALTSLDSDVGTIVLDSTPQPHQILITLSISGKLSFIPIPDELPLPQGGKSHKVHSLLPRTSVISASKSHLLNTPVVDVAPLPGVSGSIRVVRLLKGVQPIFSSLRYMNNDGTYIQNPILDEISEDFPHEKPQLASNRRYTEPPSLVVGSGFDENNEELLTEQDQDGTLQIDLAELSLGQRLTAVADVDLNTVSDSEGDDGVTEILHQVKSTKKHARSEFTAIPSNSLTRTLIQALHSSDSRLLELCLAHSDPTLILNSVRRLPPQLAIPLITACVERFGRGPRSSNMKGGGGGASSQRGSSLLTWLRTVLVVHTGHLMTTRVGPWLITSQIPDLIARLSGLHSTLTTRLSLHESLLSLSGRLDMVLSQVELRGSTVPASLPLLKADKKGPGVPVKIYVEGETDSGEEDAKMDIEIEAGSDDEGSIEDIELGGNSENDDDDDDDFSDSQDEDEAMNGFIDYEAEEISDEDHDEDESE